MTRYLWVAARRAEGFPTKPACDAAGVSRQAFYDWSVRQKAGPSPRELADAELVGAIRAVHAESGGAYGSPGVTAQLRRQGRRANRKRVERLMRRNGICGIHKRRKPRLKGSGPSGSAPEDLVRRRFRPGRPDRVWASDITYVPTGQGWLHLAVVLDVGSRRLIGYSMADHARSELVVDALDTAAASRGHRTAGVIFHSDRGPQYLSGQHASALARHQMRQSAGRVGNCWDCEHDMGVVLRIPQTRARHTNPLRDPQPGPPRDLRLDRPLQHPQNPLHPRLPHPHRMGGPPPTTTRTSRTNQVTGQRGELSFPPNRGEFVFEGRGCGPVRILRGWSFRLRSGGGAGCTRCGPIG